MPARRFRCFRHFTADFGLGDPNRDRFVVVGTITKINEVRRPRIRKPVKRRKRRALHETAGDTVVQVGNWWQGGTSTHNQKAASWKRRVADVDLVYLGASSVFN